MVGQSIKSKEELVFKEMRHIKPQALHFYRLYMFSLLKLPPPGCAGDYVNYHVFEPANGYNGKNIYIAFKLVQAFSGHLGLQSSKKRGGVQGAIHKQVWGGFKKFASLNSEAERLGRFPLCLKTWLLLRCRFIAYQWQHLVCLAWTPLKQEHDFFRNLHSPLGEEAKTAYIYIYLTSIFYTIKNTGFFVFFPSQHTKLQPSPNATRQWFSEEPPGASRGTSPGVAFLGLRKAPALAVNGL